MGCVDGTRGVEDDFQQASERLKPNISSGWRNCNFDVNPNIINQMNRPFGCLCVIFFSSSLFLRQSKHIKKEATKLTKEHTKRKNNEWQKDSERLSVSDECWVNNLDLQIKRLIRPQWIQSKWRVYTHIITHNRKKTEKRMKHSRWENESQFTRSFFLQMRKLFTFVRNGKVK